MDSSPSVQGSMHSSDVSDVDDTQLTTSGPSIVEHATTGLTLTACNFTGPLKAYTTSNKAIRVMRTLTEQERIDNVYQILNLGEKYVNVLQVETYITVREVGGTFQNQKNFKDLNLAKNYPGLHNMTGSGEQNQVQKQTVATALYKRWKLTP
jgi:hypothetical protein